MSQPEFKSDSTGHGGTDRPRARYVMVGGFLGAGKTTALGQLGRYFSEKGLRVGLICNDQSTGLVDTAILRSKGFPVEEITGGCFCCRFQSLVDAADGLTRDAAPDVFLAEPVGSCTDLVATVSYPLRRIYGDRFTVAPLSVLVDPARAMRLFGLVETGKSFSEKVTYVYRKQLEEADIIVLNKADAHPAEALEQLADRMREEFPGKTILTGSAKEGSGLDDWFQQIADSAQGDAPALEIDYDIYAEGEALLGWLNCTVRLESDTPFDANRSLVRLTGDLRDRIAARAGGDIAHLKMTLDSEDGTGSLSVVSLVRNDDEPDLRESLLDLVDGGSLVINLRAEVDPEHLAEDVKAAIASLAEREPGLRATLEHLEQLRPGRPVPTHRMAPLGGDATP